MRVLRWIGVVLGALVALLAVAAAGVYVASSVRLNKTYAIPAEQIDIPADPASIARGRHLATTIGQCVDCHGDDLAGRVFLDTPGIARISSANLTSGAGGVGATFTDADWVRALRHGVGPNGKALLVMPSQGFNSLSPGDLGAVIAYVKSMPPVDRQPEQNSVQLLGRALFLAGIIDALAAERVDHGAALAPAPAPGVTAEYGGYLVRVGGCADCHAASLAGGPIPGAPPDAPPAANITPSGEISAWSEADFITTMRTGENPAGLKLNPFMPWKFIGGLSDDELKALFMYLKTVPPQPTPQ